MEYQLEKLPNIAATVDITPHMVMFPLPMQGPVNCTLKLAELILSLSQAEISVTFINTGFIQTQLELNSPASSRLARFGPAFQFETVSDGLGPDQNHLGIETLADRTNSLAAQAQTTGGRLRELLGVESGRKPVTCIIADVLYWFLVDISTEMNVPLVYFETVNPSAFWTYCFVPQMLQDGDIPLKGGDFDAE